MRIEPIEQKGTRTGLLSVATSIPGSEAWTRGGSGGDFGPGSWPEYILFEQEAGEAGGVVSACSLGTNVFVDPADETTSPKFGPFYVYGSSRCASILARGSDELSIMRKSAEANLEARKSFDIEHTAWTGKDSAGADILLSDGSTTIPDFQLATVITGGSTAGQISTVVGELIKAARAAGLKGQITFHTPDWAYPAWADTGMLIKIGDVWYIGGEHPVVFGAGYTGVVGVLTAAAGQAPIVATGRVEYALSASVQREFGPQSDSDLAYFDARQNRTRVTAVKVAMVRWNTNYVWAALALNAGN